MKRGSIADFDLVVALTKDIEVNGDPAWGACAAKPEDNLVAIMLDETLKGPAMLRYWFHEALHACCDVTGIDLSHKNIYTLSALLAQASVSTGIIDPYGVEVRLRLDKLNETAEEKDLAKK